MLHSSFFLYFSFLAITLYIYLLLLCFLFTTSLLRFYSSFGPWSGWTIHSGECTRYGCIPVLIFYKGVTDDKKEKEEKEERAEKDDRTGKVEESPSSADTCSPALHTNQEAKVTDIPLEHDTLPQGEDLLVKSRLYLSPLIPPPFIYANNNIIHSPFPAILLYLLL